MRAIIISAVTSLLIGGGAGKVLQFDGAAFPAPVESSGVPLSTDDPGLAAYKTLVGSQGVSIAPSTYFAPARIDYPLASDDGADLAYLDASTRETRRQLAALEAEMDRDRAAHVQAASFDLAVLPVPDSAATRWSGRLGLGDDTPAAPAPAAVSPAPEPVAETPTAEASADPQ